MRSALACLSLGLVAACSGGSAAPASAPAPSPPPAPPPAAVAAPETPAATPAAAPERPPARERAASQLRLLREARRAARAHDHTTALDRFDQMLRAAPRSPRLACEAGFVAHQAGRDDLAEQRIELALRGFGPDERLAPDMRVPAAMCLFNAGLVYEARGDRTAAADAYDRSLRLRPNDVVRRRREALGASVEDEVREDGLVAEAASEAELVAVLERTFAGDSWDDERERASAERIGRIALPPDGLFTRALLFSVNDHSPMLETVFYVLALERRAGGHLLFATEAGFVDTQYNGSNDSSDATLRTFGLDHGLLRIDFTIRSGNEMQNEYEWEEHPEYDCYEISTEPDHVLEITMLCSLASPQCLTIDGASRVVGRGTYDITCSDDEGDDVPGPRVRPEPASDDGRPRYESRVEVGDGPIVRVVPLSGTLPEPRLAGEHPWAEALGIAGAIHPVEPSSDEDDSSEDDGDEDDSDEDDGAED